MTRRRRADASTERRGASADRGRAGVVTGLPLLLLRTEGLALLALAAVLYRENGTSWWLFAILLPAPDLGLLGYLRSTWAGAVAYDLTHTYAPPAVLGAVGVLTGSSLAAALALIWFAHIGMDRALGLGLQYPDGSGSTHLKSGASGWFGHRQSTSDVRPAAASNGPRYAYLYFMRDDPDRIREAVGRHVQHWHHQRLPGYLGGPFEDRSGGLITFHADGAEPARRLVADDPFAREGLIHSSWLKEWTANALDPDDAEPGADPARE